MKTIIFSIVLCLISNGLFSQEDTTSNKSSKNNNAYSFTYKNYFINPDDLNDRLKLYNYPELSINMFSLGIEFYFFPVTDRLIYKMGVAYCGQTQENDAVKINLTRADISFDWGYNVLKKEKIFLYPVLGFGWSWAFLKLTDKTVESETFNQALSNINGTQEMYNHNKSFIWNLNFGAKLDWAISKEKDLLIGLDLGYRLQLSKSEWKTNNSNLQDSPNINLSGFYTGIHITIY